MQDVENVFLKNIILWYHSYPSYDEFYSDFDNLGIIN